MSNKIQIFDLSNSSGISLTSTKFKREGSSFPYVCKITDASILFIGGNSKFEKAKKKLFNSLSITLPEGPIGRVQENPRWDEKTNLSYNEYDGEIQLKVKLNPCTKIVDSNKKPIKIDLRNVPCTDLRESKDATIDIVVTGESKEFEGKNGEMFSYISLTATQIKIKSMNSVFDCDFL